MEPVQPWRAAAAHAAGSAVTVLGTLRGVRQTVRKGAGDTGSRHAEANAGTGSLAASRLVEGGRRWRDTKPDGEAHRAVPRKTSADQVMARTRRRGHRHARAGGA